MEINNVTKIENVSPDFNSDMSLNFKVLKDC